jgi:hypothetical protein
MQIDKKIIIGVLVFIGDHCIRIIHWCYSANNGGATATTENSEVS